MNRPYVIASMWLSSSRTYDSAATSWIGRRSSKSCIHHRLV